MPPNDKLHPIVLRCLTKAGWTILSEQEYITMGNIYETSRRLYIDIKAQYQDELIVLIEVKGLERSPVHELMELLGQYLIYKISLDYLGIMIPLYVAVTKSAYEDIIQHTLGQAMLSRHAIPFLVIDPITEEIVQWIPKP